MIHVLGDHGINNVEHQLASKYRRIDMDSFPIAMHCMTGDGCKLLSTEH